MTERDNVIRFHLEFHPADAPPWDQVREMEGWRRRLHAAGLIDRAPDRVAGAGYGNMSRRLDAFDPRLGGPFLITGTRTSHLPTMGAEGYSIVFACHPEQNRLIAEGPVKPSSEAMTHGMIYALRPSIAYVVHVHSSELWRAAGKLGLPGTDPAVRYGTPAMTEEVRRLLTGPFAGAESGIFVMLGHQDGLVSFGPDPESAARPLMKLLEKVRETK